jgi:hypothetical protein
MNRLALDAVTPAIICEFDEVGKGNRGILMTRKCGAGTRPRCRRISPAMRPTDQVCNIGSDSWGDFAVVSVTINSKPVLGARDDPRVDSTSHEAKKLIKLRFFGKMLT